MSGEYEREAVETPEVSAPAADETGIAVSEAPTSTSETGMPTVEKPMTNAETGIELPPEATSSSESGVSLPETSASSTAVGAEGVDNNETNPTTESNEANERIADRVVDHAYDDHHDEYGCQSKEDFKNIAMEHLESTNKKDVYAGECTMYWSSDHQSVLIDNHISPENSTMFKPDDGYDYYKRQY